MSIFQLATVLIYVTSVLTSSVNQASNNSRNPTHPALNSLFGPPPIPTENSTQSADTGVVNENDPNPLLKSKTTERIMTEGGDRLGPNIDTKTQSSQTPDPPNKDKPSVGLEPSNEPILGEQPEEFPSHPKKVKNKVIPRKGVGDEFPPDSSSSSTTVGPDVEILDKQAPSLVKTSTELPVDKTEPNTSVNKNTEGRGSPKDISLDKKPETNSTKTRPATVIVVDNNANDTTPHKHKPTYTNGEGDDDGKGMPSSPTQKEIGMPRKVDYIIPLVITIMATPVLGIAAFILYTRGRDCWDKRHYRRMDFLVEGMYND